MPRHSEQNLRTNRVLEEAKACNSSCLEPSGLRHFRAEGEEVTLKKVTWRRNRIKRLNERSER